MKINLTNQFGAAGVAVHGVDGIAMSGVRPLAHGLATPKGFPGPAGDEQLR